MEGILIHRVPAAFAGRRRNMDLGRSDSSAWGSFPGSRSHRRQRMSSGQDAEEGNVVGVRQAHALDLSTPNKRLHARGHVLRSVQRPVHVRSPLHIRYSPGASRARWGGRFGIAVGQTCASRRNRHRGLIERTTARLAAVHRSRNQPREVVRDPSETGRWSWPSSLRGNESPELSARTS